MTVAEQPSGADGSGSIRYPIVDRPQCPVIWLDAFAVSTFASSLAGRGQNAGLNARRYSRLLDLVRSNAAICLETDQLVELRDKPKTVDASVHVLMALASAFRTPRSLIEEAQERVAMHAYVRGGQSAQLLWAEAFPRAGAAAGPFEVRAIIGDDQSISDSRERKTVVVEQWATIQGTVSTAPIHERQRFERQLAEERLGMVQALDGWFSTIASDISPSGDDTELLDALYAVRSRRLRWESAGGVGLEGLREFYGSPHYFDLPYVQIGAELRSLLMAKPQPLKPSDNMDVFNIAAVLPYADLMVLDRAMIEAADKLGLSRRFGCVTARLVELDAFLDSVETGEWIRS